MRWVYVRDISDDERGLGPTPAHSLNTLNTSLGFCIIASRITLVRAIETIEIRVLLVAMVSSFSCLGQWRVSHRMSHNEPMYLEDAGESRGSTLFGRVPGVTLWGRSVLSDVSSVHLWYDAMLDSARSDGPSARNPQHPLLVSENGQLPCGRTARAEPYRTSGRTGRSIVTINVNALI